VEKRGHRRPIDDFFRWLAEEQRETARRYRKYALQAYQGAMNLIVGTSMSREQEYELWNRLVPVREWLEASGLLKR
jgi:hypothetical protein